MAFQDCFENILQRVPFFFSQPVANLPTQPLVRLPNPKTPLLFLQDSAGGRNLLLLFQRVILGEFLKF